MKLTAITSAALLTVSTLSAPTDTTYGPPEGGWESIDYPAGTGENLPYYPPPPGGWENVQDPPGTGPGPGSNCNSSPFIFTSTYHVTAVGSEVRNGTTPAPGPKDAVGLFEFRISSLEDTICYNITLLNVAGAYQSPAKTATHIHEAAHGASGPPKIAFLNPVGDDRRRVSVGCLTGPFTTGINEPGGMDTGSKFMVKQIEDNPAGFFADSNTEFFPLGVVRGQMA